MSNEKFVPSQKCIQCRRRDSIRLETEFYKKFFDECMIKGRENEFINFFVIERKAQEYCKKQKIKYRYTLYSYKIITKILKGRMIKRRNDMYFGLKWKDGGNA